MTNKWVISLQDPVPAKSWGNKVLDVTKEGPVCIQHGITFGIIAGVEDCLALNVYTPSVTISILPTRYIPFIILCFLIEKL